ncbi:MAG: hypothetical protein ACYCU0_10435 [Solirubrobacteraceae bacterium]
MSDTITLALDGVVSLSDFSAAVARFNGLVDALAADAKVEHVIWQIDALDSGSASMTARGVSENGAQPEQIARVVRAYLEVGQALERENTIPFSPRVQKEARAIVGILPGSTVEAIRFETAESDAIIRRQAMPPVAPVVATEREEAYGVVTGRIQTLTSRKSLRFTLYDHIHGRAVSCYLDEGRESLMREMWNRFAAVEGWVRRDPETGRPLSIKHITRVTPLPEVEFDAYKAARGSIPRGDDDPSPEALTRKLRDG